MVLESRTDTKPLEEFEEVGRLTREGQEKEIMVYDLRR